MSKFILNRDGSVEQDKVILCDRLLHKKVEIYPVENLRIKMNLNANDTVSFKTYKYNNGKVNPLWNEIDDIAIILVQGKGYFEISVPKTVEDCDYKEITGISLCEAETSQTNVTLEINTENDIAREDYVETVLYNPDNTEGSLLHRVFQSMPHYKIGHVDESIAGMQRTFSCDDQSVYDFLQTVAEELECIFIFDNFSRTVNCYQLEDFGVDSGVFVDGTENLAENITVTGDKDSVKNCFKIEGGDDVITDRIGNRLIGGNYIWKFSEYQLKQMSETLQNALADRNGLISSYQDQYNTLWDEYNEKKDKISYYTSGMMPGEDTDDTTAQSVFEEIFGKNGNGGKITYGCVANKNQRAEAVGRSIEKFAQVLAPSGYTIELQDVAGTPSTEIPTSISFKVYVYLTGRYEEDGKTLKDTFTSEIITLPVKDGSIMYYSQENNIFTTDYYLYLKQQMDIMEAKSDITDDVISFEPPLTDVTYNNEENPNNYSPIHYSMYCINRLQSFCDAYEICSQVLAELNSNISSDSTNVLKYIKPDGSQDSICDALLSKYGRYMELISARITYLQNKVDILQEESKSLKKQIEEIRNACDMMNFLKNYENGIHGDDLWIELCSFRRQDTYKNDNYIGEDMDEATLMENVEGLIKRAEEEIAKACEVNYSINTTLDNLLTMREFQLFWDNFDLGNYIHIRIDEKIYKLRLISIIYNYDDVAHIEVEFSETTKSKNSVSDLRNIIQQASSMASSYNFVARQAEKGSIASTEFNDMLENGLAITNTMILDAQNQKPLIDEHGITGRKWNDDTQSYEPEQSRWINNLLCFTDDNWKHTKCALGKICYYDSEKGEYVYNYGLIAESLISNIIMSEICRIMNQSGTYTIDDNGFHIVNGTNKIEINAKDATFYIEKDNEVVFSYSPTDGLFINGNGKFTGDISGSTITGGSINIKDTFVVDNDGNAKVNITGGNIQIQTSIDSENQIVLKYGEADEDKRDVTYSITKDGIQGSYVEDTKISRTYDVDSMAISEGKLKTAFKREYRPQGGTTSVLAESNGNISFVATNKSSMLTPVPLLDTPYFESDVPFYSTNIKSGSVVKEITALDMRFTVDVELDMPSKPNVVVTPETTDVLGNVFVNVSNVSKNGFTINMRRTDTTGNLQVNWIAMC